MGKSLFRQIVGTVGQAAVFVGAGAVALGGTVVKNRNIMTVTPTVAGNIIKEIEKWKDKDTKK